LIDCFALILVVKDLYILAN